MNTLKEIFKICLNVYMKAFITNWAAPRGYPKAPRCYPDFLWFEVTRYLYLLKIFHGPNSLKNATQKREGRGG